VPARSKRYPVVIEMVHWYQYNMPRPKVKYVVIVDANTTLYLFQKAREFAVRCGNRIVLLPYDINEVDPEAASRLGPLAECLLAVARALGKAPEAEVLKYVATMGRVLG